MTHRQYWLLSCVLCLGLCGSAIAQEKTNETFVIKITLPRQTLHLGDLLNINVVFSNPTNHIVKMGQGQNGGLDVEAFNGKHEDIGTHVSGSADMGKRGHPTFGPAEKEFKPGRSQSLMWSLVPDLKYLTPGTYVLRVHVLDTIAHTQLYSNSQTLQVIQ